MAQISTKIVSIKVVMARPMFQRGYTDAMCGAKFDKDYDSWSTTQQWNYERGRLFFYGAGMVRLKQGRGVSKQAIVKYNKLRREGVMI